MNTLLNTLINHIKSNIDLDYKKRVTKEELHSSNVIFLELNNFIHTAKTVDCNYSIFKENEDESITMIDYVNYTNNEVFFNYYTINKNNEIKRNILYVDYNDIKTKNNILQLINNTLKTI